MISFFILLGLGVLVWQGAGVTLYELLLLSCPTCIDLPVVHIMLVTTVESFVRKECQVIKFECGVELSFWLGVRGTLLLLEWRPA